MLQPLGKLMIIAGGILIVVGVLFLFGDKIPLIGMLPGDIVIRKKNVTIYIPIVTSILLSVLLTILLSLFRK